MGKMLDSFMKSFIVAEKKRFCLVLGRQRSIMARLSSKSPFSMRSASSTTRYFRLSKENVSQPVRWSARRPGIATTICGRCISFWLSIIWSVPPDTTQTRTPIAWPATRNCSDIWYASSCVGVKTKAKWLTGSSLSFSRMGKAKAKVFPDPVLAAPMQSRPDKIAGIQFCWMGVAPFSPERRDSCLL